MQELHIYSKDYCPYCHRAKKLLSIKGVPYTDYDVTSNSILEAEMQRRSGHRTVPQIFIGSQHIGGCDDLFALDENGQLDSLLELLTS